MSVLILYYFVLMSPRGWRYIAETRRRVRVYGWLVILCKLCVRAYVWMITMSIESGVRLWRMRNGYVKENQQVHCVCVLLLLLLLSSSSSSSLVSPLCRVFTIINLQQTMFLGVYVVAAVVYLQSVLHVMLFRPKSVLCTFTLALSVLCVQCPMWLLFVAT